MSAELTGAQIRNGVTNALVTFVLAVAGVATRAEDWPTYRHDNQRSGITTERLAFPLGPAWSFVPQHAPEAAWEAPRDVPVEGILELGRVQFDDTFHVAVANGLLFFGSSSDHRVMALDAATGDVRWSVFTEGPVRLAPAVAGERVYVGSDDGFAYCLDAGSGRIAWKKRIGPKADRLLGHGKMISTWPLRTGILVDAGIAYCGAGIWPAEGVYMQAMRAESGEMVWRNDTSGETTATIVSPQGYLLATGDELFAPQGRVPPAAYARATGRYKYTATFGKTIGGTNALIADDILYTGTEELMSYRRQTRERFAWFAGRQVIVTSDMAYSLDGEHMTAMNREQYAAPSTKRFSLRDQRTRLGYELGTAKRTRDQAARSAKRAEADLSQLDEKIAALPAGTEPAPDLIAKRAAQQTSADTAARALVEAEAVVAGLEDRRRDLDVEWDKTGADMTSTQLWQTPCECAESLILAGDVLIAGGQGSVVAVQARTGKQIWSATVDGKAKGLAVANGRLYVSTDRGPIYCFGAPGSPDRGRVLEPTGSVAGPGAAAKAIVAHSGVTRGYAVVIGVETGRLALGLAALTDLTVYALCPDATKADAVRQTLRSVGAYGKRVCVDVAPPDRIPYSDYFANLIVSELPLDAVPTGEIKRLLKPCGGVVMMGAPRNAPSGPPSPDALQRWLAATGVSGAELIEQDGVWIKATRGPLPGAGSWTHQYADAGNTTCGYDSIVKCPLGLLWFGRPGPLHMISRHRRAAAPLTVNGVLFVQGEHQVMAYDAYNGLLLWEYKVPNVVRDVVSHDCSNLAADDTSFYVATQGTCLRLEATTGELLSTYEIPKAAGGGRWGYVACSDGVLLGTRTPGTRECNALFAIDVASGKRLWVHEGKSIHQPSISAADGRVFFVDDNTATQARRDALRRRMGKLTPAEAEKVLKDAPVRTAFCLDTRTGEQQWSRPMDLTGGIGGPYWSALGSMVRKGVLVFFGIYMDGHYWRDFFAGQFESRRILAVNAYDGATLWEKHIGYRVRPLIINETLHAEPWAYDLRTGRQLTRTNPITGREEPWQFARPGHHCGCPAGSPNVLFFRSQHIGYYDLIRDSGVTHFSTQRTGCWINFIFGNGLIMVPEASSSCMCPFANQTTVVFKPRDTNRAWTQYSMSGTMTPVKRLAVNIGAPGDRCDEDGTLWLCHPRPGGSLVLQFKAELGGWPGGGIFKENPDFVDVENTAAPWLYTSGYRGLRRYTLPLLAAGDGTARYTVRLHFADTDNDQPGARVFDVSLQGSPVLTSFDPVKEAGGGNRAVVKEVAGVEVSEALTIDLTPKVAKPTPRQAPILQGVEVVREQVLSAGLLAPSYLLNNAAPKAVADARIANHKDSAFDGVLRITVPAGFEATPPEAAVSVSSGGTKIVPVTLAATAQAERGEHPVTFTLLRADGGIEAEAAGVVEFLGDRRRTVIKASADLYVGASFPKGRRHNTGTILVDGGNSKIGDESHHVVYLKFPLGVPGKPLSATLRLFNASNPTSNGGNVCLLTEPWDEGTISYENRPKPGRVLGNIGRVESTATLVVPLDISSLEGMSELNVAIDPVNCDGTDYLTKESGKPAELVVEYK